MKKYVYKRTEDGIHIINLGRTWEKIMVAARAIVAIENPEDIMVVSQRPYGSRAVLKLSHYIGSHPIAGRWTPGEPFNARVCVCVFVFVFVFFVVENI